MKQQSTCSAPKDEYKDAGLLKKSHTSDLIIDLTDLTNKKVRATSTPSGITNGDELVWTFTMKKNGVTVPNQGIVDIDLVYSLPLSSDPPPSTPGGNQTRVTIVEPSTGRPAQVSYNVKHNGSLLTWDGSTPYLVIDDIGDPTMDPGPHCDYRWGNRRNRRGSK